MQLLDRLKEIPLFEDIDESVISSIISRGITKTYRKGEMILFEGRENNNFFVILKGEVKVTKRVEDLKELILTFLKEDEHFGEVSLFDGTPSTANIIVTRNSTMFIIDKNELLSIMVKNPDLTISLIQRVGERLRETNNLIKTISMQPAEGKVAYLLSTLAEKTGRIKNHTVEIDDFPSQKDMAGMLGVARETISRQMHAFLEKDIIRRENQTIKILDYDKFKKLFN